MEFRFLTVLFLIHTFLWICLSHLQIKVKQSPKRLIKNMFSTIASLLIIVSWSIMICAFSFLIYNLVICNWLNAFYIFLVLSFGVIYILLTLKKYNYSIKERQSLTVAQCLLLGLIYALLLV